MSRTGAEDTQIRKRRRILEPPAGFETQRKTSRPKTGNVQVPQLVSELRTNAITHSIPGPSKPKPVAKTLVPEFQLVSFKPKNPIPNFVLPLRDEDPSGFRVLPPPDLPRPNGSNDMKAMNLQQRLLPPPLHLPNPVLSTHNVPLKHLPPPPRLSSSTEITKDDKAMRTISTTDIALATDLSTDSGAAELAHIFLQDQHPDIVGHNDQSLNWNIGLSPTKGSKGKGKEGNFTKNGLALQASEIKKRFFTDLVLWQKDIENSLASSRRATPDLRLRIIRILDTPSGAKSSSPRKPRPTPATSSPGLAICRVLSASVPKYSNLTKTKERQYYLIVLSFPSTAPMRSRGQARIHARNPEDFTAGREVYIWEPWQEVSLSSQRHSMKSTLPVDDTLAGTELQGPIPAPFPFLTSTFPSPSPPESVKEDDTRIADTVLLCSRFVIIP